MPLKKSNSISKNIKELMDANKGNKKIGNTKKSQTKAQKVKQAVAIAYSLKKKK